MAMSPLNDKAQDGNKLPPTERMMAIITNRMLWRPWQLVIKLPLTTEGNKRSQGSKNGTINKCKKTLVSSPETVSIDP